MKKTMHLVLTFILILLNIRIPAAQTQLGNDIDGEAKGDDSGYPVTLSPDGNRVAIGARNNDGNGEDVGHVRIYEWSGIEWDQMGEDMDGDSLYLGFKSTSFSSNGNRIAVGEVNSFWGSLGRTRIFDWSGSDWVQVGEDITGEEKNDEFGFSVSLSSDGSRIAVSARSGNDANGESKGFVRIFDWTGTAWLQVGNTIEGEAKFEKFGQSVSLSSDGNRIVVGAPLNDDNGYDSGYVKIYEWNGSSWGQLGNNLYGDLSGCNFGHSTSISSTGDTMAVGAHRYYGPNGSSSGLVRVFHWTGDSWEQLGNDLYGDGMTEFFGHSVSLSADGKRLATGAYHHDGNGLNQSGHVRIFDWTGATWSQVGMDINGEAENDASGVSISLSADGKRVAIGALNNDGNGDNAGHVRIFDLCDTIHSVINVTACDMYIAPNGQEYNVSGQYFAVVPTNSTCDSIVKVNLSIVHLDNGISQNNDTLLTNVTGVSYQWLDCVNGFMPISNEVSSFFIPSVSGSFAVQITDSLCTVTSDCIDVIISSTDQREKLPINFLYPNPASGKLAISCGLNLPINMKIVDLTGKAVISKKLVHEKSEIDLGKIPQGNYVVMLNNGEEFAVLKLFKSD